MQPLDIEAWTLRVAQSVSSGHRVEDHRVECKTEWPPPERAARQIAGHCNAAGGSSVLWLIGVDENGAAIKGAAPDPADWLSSVASRFDGLAPAVTHIKVPFGESMITALLFDSSRAPYVVRNDNYGKPGAGPVEFEVPYRRGTSTRTANRQDLVRLIAPQVAPPALELLEGTVLVQWKAEEAKGAFRRGWHATLIFYVVPATERSLVFPCHRTSTVLDLGVEGIDVATARVQFYGDVGLTDPDAMGSRSSVALSATVFSTPSELVVRGPGRFRLFAAWGTSGDFRLPETPRIRVELLPVGSDRPLIVQPEFGPCRDTGADDLRVFEWAALPAAAV